MIFPYKVKHNGVNYEIGADVPISETPLKVEVPKITEESKVEPIIEEKPIVDNVETKPVSKYTKTDIYRFSTSELKKVAKENGIDSTKTGMELKKELIAYFGL